MRISILDKYIVKCMSGPFIFGVAAFSTIFVASGFLFRVAQYMTEYGASVSSVFRLFLCLMPEVINYCFPMAVLLATLLAFGSLSSNSEITAMRSGGVSFARLALPAILAGFAISMFSVIWAEKVVPPAKVEYARIVDYEIKHDTKPKTQEHVIIKTLKGSEIDKLTYARSFDEEKGEMKNITIEEFDKGQLARIQRTGRAMWKNGAWTMDAGTVTELNKDVGIARTMTFSKQVLPITVEPREITLAQKQPDEMTIAELKQYIAVLEHQYLPTAKYWMAMWQRFSIPMASVFFVMIGAPLGVQSQRSSSSMGLGVSVLIIFIYYSIMTFFTGLGNGGAVPPFLAAMIPNFLCGLTGAYLIYRKDK